MPCRAIKAVFSLETTTTATCTTCLQITVHEKTPFKALYCPAGPLKSDLRGRKAAAEATPPRSHTAHSEPERPLGVHELSITQKMRSPKGPLESRYRLSHSKSQARKAPWNPGTVYHTVNSEPERPFGIQVLSIIVKSDFTFDRFTAACLSPRSPGRPFYIWPAL